MIFGDSRAAGNITELFAEHFLEQQHQEHSSDSLYHVMHVCMYVCMYVHTYIHTYILISIFNISNYFTKFNVQGSVHHKYPDIFPTRCNITQFIYFWKTALHVSGGISTHHQEHTQLYLQYLVLVKPLLLPATIVEELELVWVCCGKCIDLFWCWQHQNRSIHFPFYLLCLPTHRDIWLVPVAVTTVLSTPDDGCERHPKHVEWSCSKIKYWLLIVASCWTFIIYREYF